MESNSFHTDDDFGFPLRRKFRSHSFAKICMTTNYELVQNLLVSTRVERFSDSTSDSIPFQLRAKERKKEGERERGRDHQQRYCSTD
jgi:hypothetical protein